VQIERSLPKIKSPERRHDRQTDLAKKRTVLKLVRERLDLITEEVEGGLIGLDGAAVSEAEDDENEEEDEDLLLGVTPSSSAASEGLKEDETGEEEEEDESLQRDPITTTTTTTSTLRHRHHHPHTTNTSPSTSTTTTALLQPNAPPSISHPTQPSSPLQTTESTESTLTTHRLEQETLTDSLVTLASQLKASSHAFQSSLEAEKSILSRAVDGLDRNITGLEVAGKKMGVLRRMTEGRGWLGRMIMYAWIFALWLLAVGIVFLGPKIRF
jgi:hypothetical protein